MPSLEVKGVRFRTDGLRPETRSYLEKKLNRIRRRERRAWNPFLRLVRALLPRDWREDPLEGCVEGRALVVGSAGGVEAIGLGAVGIDIDRTLLKIAAELGAHVEGRNGGGVPPAAGWLAASGGDLPFGAEVFDTVLSDNVVEHFPFPVLLRHLREARRVLRRGGRCVITTPNRLFEVPARAGHVSLHSYAEWEAMLRSAGFGEIRTPRRRSGPLGTPEGKKEKERRAAERGTRLGLSNRGLRMVTLIAQKER